MAEEEKDLSLWQKSRGALVWGIIVILGAVVVLVAYNNVMNRLRQEVAAGIVLGVQTALQDSTTRAALFNVVESDEMRVAIREVAWPYMNDANGKVMYLAYMFNAFSRDVLGKEFKPMQNADELGDGIAHVRGMNLKLDDFQFVPKKATPASKAEAPQEGEKKKAPAAEPVPKKKLTW